MTADGENGHEIPLFTGASLAESARAVKERSCPEGYVRCVIGTYGLSWAPLYRLSGR